MVDRALLSVKLADLADRTHRVRTHCPASLPELAADRDALDLVSFNLMLAVQACSDIAAHLIADEGWPAATTIAGAFARLHDQGVISKAVANALGRAVGLRNVVAHGYAGINPAMVFAAATAGVRDLEAFAREVAAWATSQAGPTA